MCETEAIRIVLDTNILCADYRMTGTAFRVFLSGVSRIGASVYVPAIVFDETCAKYMEDLSTLVSRLRGGARDWQRFSDLWFEAHRNHWIWLIVSFAGGVVGGLLVNWLSR